MNGSIFSNVNIVQLESYGGLTLEHVKNFELWRLFASQLIHAKQMHMFYNVLSLIALGIFVESYMNSVKFFLLWFISGATGTVASTLFIAPPWNLGTGGSQAVLGIAGFSLILSFKNINSSKWFYIALAFAIVPAFTLDFIHVGYTKFGHIVSLVIGVIVGLVIVESGKKPIQK